MKSSFRYLLHHNDRQTITGHLLPSLIQQFSNSHSLDHFILHPTTAVNNVDKALTSATRRLLRLPRSPKTGVGSGPAAGSGTGSGTGSGPGAALIAYREMSKNVSTSVNFMVRPLMRLRTYLEYSRFK